MWLITFLPKGIRKIAMINRILTGAATEVNTPIKNWHVAVVSFPTILQEDAQLLINTLQNATYHVRLATPSTSIVHGFTLIP